MIKSESLNFQMIHIASELVALAGITFYFTSKHNSVMSEIKKLQNIIQSQQTTIASYNKRFENLQKTIDNLQTQIDTKLSEKNDMFHSQLSMMHDPSFLQSAIIHDNEPLRFPPR
jgi:predicted  nucleic acid-binding Zn-ribbon protein